MKEIFESYKTPELRFLVREHNKKIKEVVKNEVKQIKERILKKRLIDLRFLKRPEIINKLLENKKFFKNLKQRPEDFNIKKSKAPEIKASIIKEEIKKAPTPKPRTLKTKPVPAPRKPKPTPPTPAPRPKTKTKKEEEEEKEADERLQALRKRIGARKKKKGDENPFVAKIQKQTPKERKQNLERIKRREKRQVETGELLIQYARSLGLSEKEKSEVNKIDARVQNDSQDQKDLERLKRIIRKYEKEIPIEQPRQNKLKNLQNTISRLRKSLKEGIKSKVIKKQTEEKLKEAIEEKEAIQKENKEKKKKAKESKPKPQKKKPVKKEKKEKPKPKPVEKPKPKPAEKKADFKKNPDVSPFFQINQKTQELILKALPPAEAYNKDDQRDLYENILENYAEIITGRETLESIKEDEKFSDENEFKLFEYMVKNDLIKKDLNDILKNANEELKEKKRIDEEFKKEQKRIAEEEAKEAEEIKKKLSKASF